MRKSYKKEVLTFVGVTVAFIIGAIGAFVLLTMFAGCAAKPVTQEPSVVTQQPSVGSEPITTAKSCTGYSWKDRGRAPIGFMKGMIQSYRIAQCTSTPASGPISDKVCNSKRGYYCDALKNYGMKPGNELLKTYTFLIGLAQRESSGNFSEGLDVSSDQPWKPETTEAGAFQISYDGMNAHPELKKIYAYYQSHPELCLMNVYSEGIKIKTGGYIGSGEGRFFQEFVRGCPGVQAPLAAVYVRFLSTHFGPINTKKVEYVQACEDMLKANEVKCQ